MTEFAINLIIIAILLVIVAAIIFYIVREKKRGSKCIGCPYAKNCGRGGKGGCGSHDSPNR